MSYQRTPVGAFRGNAVELMGILEAPPPGEDNKLLNFKAFHVGESFMDTIRPAVTSSTLVFQGR